MSIRYRPEIDGLRAVAVLLVLFCHAGFAFFKGGYIGVDIFFVISGFLITSLIVQDLHQGTFSFINFWERRIRRIMPPLVLVVVASLVAGWFLLLPLDYKLLGEQAATQSVFASNILFKTQSGYFDTESTLKPLLHTWSLAVEEQFYFFFPLAFYWLHKRKPEKTSKYMTAVLILSFILTLIIMRRSPSSGFYLQPFRAWELLVGTMLALRPVTFMGTFTGWKKEILGGAGIVAIAIAAVLYDDDTNFPGIAALLPCLGAAAIIASNAGGLNIVGKILSLRAVVFIGLVSYSLYLWHWPIFTFVRYSGLIEFTPSIAALCMGASFILAVLTWKFVETPFRKKIFFPTTRTIYSFFAGVLVLLAGAGLTIVVMDGVPKRLPESVSIYAHGSEDTNPHRKECDKPNFERFATGDLCQTNKDIAPSFVLWGDSFGDAVAPAIYELSKDYNKNGYVFTAHGCPPILGYNQSGKLKFDCEGFNDRVFKLIEDKKIKHVILVGNWLDRLRNNKYLFKDQSWYAPYKDAYPNIVMAAMQRTIDELKKRGVTVYLLLDFPGAAYDPPRYLAMGELYNVPRNLDTKKSEFLDVRNNLMAGFLKKNKKNLVLIDAVDRLCDTETCHIALDGRTLYYDKGHLSYTGALYVAPIFEPYFKKGL